LEKRTAKIAIFWAGKKKRSHVAIFRQLVSIKWWQVFGDNVNRQTRCWARSHAH
jgi:hypothetical protein